MIIGICGHKGSGKDYLGAILREYTGFKIVHFADPLKEMIVFLLNISIVAACPEKNLTTHPSVSDTILAPRPDRAAQQKKGESEDG